MKLAVYLSGVPAKAKNSEKRDTLRRFATGARFCGDDVEIVDNFDIMDCDVAVIQGWIGMKSAPHLELRRRVIEQQRLTDGHTLVMDSNLFGFLDPGDFNKYLRYSLDDIFADQGYYFDRDPDLSRWAQIKQAYGFQERPWQRGNNVLITLQRNGGWSMGTVPIQAWLDDIIPQIRLVTDRPIVVRPHPGDQKIINSIDFRSWTKVSWSRCSDIRQDLDQTWATITYNSSPAVVSLLWGVPAWITDPRPARSQAYPWAQTDIGLLEKRFEPLDREHLYHKISQCHWSNQELDSGRAWQFMRQRLPKIACQ